MVEFQPLSPLALPRAVRLVGTGVAFPSRVIAAGDLREGATGTRYWCAAHESTADLAEDAAMAALERAGVRPEAIDLLVVATDTPEFIVPPTAMVLQSRLALTAVHSAFDVGAGGDGFLPALDVARSGLVAQSSWQRALVVGVSAMSRYLDPHDERTASVFGDGAGAVVLEVAEAPGLLATSIRLTARDVHARGIYAGGARTPITPAILDAGIQNRLRWTGPMPPALDPGQIVPQLEALLAQAGVVAADVHRWCWSQVDAAVIPPIMTALGVDAAPVMTTTEAYGFTGPACLPITLHELLQTEALPPDAVVVLAGAGSGQDVCAAVLRLS